MRRLLPFILLLLTSPAWATWTCVQGATGCTTTTQRDCTLASGTCNITVGATTAGAIGVICAQIGNTTDTLNAPTGAGTWTVASGSLGSDATSGSRVECAYNLNETGGVTSLTCPTSSTGANGQCAYLEFTKTGTGPTFDVANGGSDASCTSCNGVSLSLTTGNNYIFIQVQNGSGTASAIDQSYTGVFPGGDGFAYKMNQTSFGTTPKWTITSSTSAVGGLAIYETTGSSPKTFPVVY